jgi:hypothetical protein
LFGGHIAKLTWPTTLRFRYRPYRPLLSLIEVRMTTSVIVAGACRSIDKLMGSPKDFSASAIVITAESLAGLKPAFRPDALAAGRPARHGGDQEAFSAMALASVRELGAAALCGAGGLHDALILPAG